MLINHRLIAISAAVYPDKISGRMKLPVSVMINPECNVYVESKNSRLDLSFDLDNLESIKTSFDDMVEHLGRMISRFRQKEDDRVPFVFGWTDDKVLSNMATALSGVATDHFRQVYDFFYDHLPRCVEHHFRIFVDNTSTQEGKSRLESLKQKKEFLRYNEKLLELKQKLDLGIPDALEELCRLAQESAMETAYYYLALNPQDYSSMRFYETGDKSDEYKSCPAFNFPAWHWKIRKAYADALKMVFGIHHALVLRCPIDTPGRPFTSVAQTYLEDKRTGYPFLE